MEKTMFYDDPKSDCIHNDGNKCNILSKCQCKYKQVCTFYLTEKQNLKNIERYNKIMNAKPLKIQEYYADKYHGGIMSWALGD